MEDVNDADEEEEGVETVAMENLDIGDVDNEDMDVEEGRRGGGRLGERGI